MKKVVDLRYDHNGVYAMHEDGMVSCFPWIHDDEEIPADGKFVEVSGRHGVRAFEVKEDSIDWSNQWNRKSVWGSDDKENIIDQIND